MDIFALYKLSSIAAIGNNFRHRQDVSEWKQFRLEVGFLDQGVKDHSESDEDVSEDETEESEASDGSLAFQLGLWAAKFLIPVVAVSSLLKLL